MKKKNVSNQSFSCTLKEMLFLESSSFGADYSSTHYTHGPAETSVDIRSIDFHSEEMDFI